MSRPKVLLSWSSGKDSAWALWRLRQADEVEVVGLLTTFNQDVDRVSMHGVRRELARAQASAVGLPLVEVPIPAECSNAQYEAVMGETLARVREDGVTEVAFGDLFLEDIRRYREDKLAPVGMRARFPLWGLDTAALAREMVAAGLRATLTAVDTEQLDPRFVGRTFDAALLDDLPPGVDPCGENGEFHTFAHRGPMFPAPLSIEVDEVVDRGRMVFADVLPANVQLP